MWGRVTVFVLGATMGWIIGSRSGREGYERVAGQASRLWRSAPVQRTGDAD